jgi:hypothetical protein
MYQAIGAGISSQPKRFDFDRMPWHRLSSRRAREINAILKITAKRLRVHTRLSAWIDVVAEYLSLE